MPFRNEDSDRLDAAEYPEPDDADDGLAPCPYCHASIYEGSERCPVCGHYLMRSESPAKPWWLIAGILLCLAMAFSWIFWG